MNCVHGMGKRRDAIATFDDTRYRLVVDTVIVHFEIIFNVQDGGVVWSDKTREGSQHFDTLTHLQSFYGFRSEILVTVADYFEYWKEQCVNEDGSLNEIGREYATSYDYVGELQFLFLSHEKQKALRDKFNYFNPGHAILEPV